ncbi:MAG: hypothetical protein V3V88_00070 [Dehalococcoidia bacterium]
MKKFLTTTLALWATFTITIPDEKLADFTENYSSRYGYQEEIEDSEGVSISNPETRAEFTKNKIKDNIKKAAEQGFNEAAEEAAREAATGYIEPDVTVE